MKTSSCFFAPTSLGVCLAAAVFFASDLPAQNAVTSSPLTTQGTAVLQSKAKATGDTNALRESVAALQARVARAVPRALAEVQGTNQLAKTSADQGVIEASQVHALVLTEEAQTATEPPAGALESLIVNNHLLNVDFGDYTKTGPAAIGQTANDYWNPYVMPYYSLGTLQNILWSDQSASPVDITVANAPGQWGNGLCVDPMYASFIYPWDSGHITVTIADLPANTYDFYVYATRASDFSPVAQFQRAGVTLWTKGTTQWGEGWYSQYWDEGEQYVRFRNIAVNSQTITVDMHPDAAGYAAISGIQIVPSSAIPSEQPVITKLLNVDFGGTGSPYKVGFGAVGLTANDFWNGDYHPGNGAVTLANLKWSDQTVGPVAMTVLNGPGCWGNSLPDPMFRSYMYSWDGGNIRITLDNLPSGICDIYLYGHTPTADDNAVFELWSDDVNWGTKGTSLIGDGPTYATWEVGQQYVLFKDVTVTAGKPLIIHAKHTTYGYNNISGMQIAYTGAADTDADGLPDGWERRWFGNLDQIASADTDSDGLNNLREYQLGTDPARADSNANGLADLYDFEKVWVEDGTPQGGYEMGDNEWWNWVNYWYDGNGWGGQELYPHSGRWWDPLMHVSDLVPGDLHQHYFSASVATMRPDVGDVLYAYVNLDSSYPPSEVMLQWYVVGEDGYGSWEHRAYWGADLIDAGQNGTASRYPMGSLPTAGQWVRLEVPASAVGLEGQIVEGMAFTLHGGRAAWDSAGTIKPDHDGDSLLDAWEMQYFGNLLQTATGDNDGDGLSNLAEFTLGYDPTNAHTGGSTASDGNKDFDSDLLSNIAEIKHYGSDPANAHTFHPSINDAEYKATGRTDGASGVYLAGPYFPGGNQIQFILIGADEATAWDLYIRPDLNPGTKWVRYYSGSPGQTVFTCPIPPGPMNFFRAGLAADFDGDGLTDGYEALVSQTGLNNPLSDADNQPDGWEVEYLVNPLLPQTPDSPSQPHPDGNYGNSDNDFFPPGFTVPIYNQDEFSSQTDPKRNNTTQQPRPVVSISVTDPNAAEGGDTATFRISRTGSTANSLTVYYVLGGSATMAADYTLNPNPTEPYPGYSITIPSGSATRDLVVTPVSDGLVEGTESVVIGLMPNVTDQYVVATSPHRTMATIRDRVCHTYELNADFLSGVLIGTEARNNQLHLRDPSQTQFPYVNVACSMRNTVVRIDADPSSPTFGTPVGEYRTVPERINGSTAPSDSPSRTTVDQYGNVWVGNRYDNFGSPSMGSVTRIGLIVGTRYLSPGDPTPNPAGFYVKIATATYNTCMDRDGDGYIKTSTGIGSAKVLAWPNLNEEDSNGGVSTAEDEAITAYARVPSTAIRSIAVDKYNDVWIGSSSAFAHGGNGINCKVDALTGQFIPDSLFTAFGCGGYGGSITPPTVLLPNGTLWSAHYGGSTLRIELPADFSSGWPPDQGTVCHNIDFSGYTGNAYGIAAHPTSGEVWQTLYDQSGQNNFGLIRWHAEGTLYTVGGNLKVYNHGGGNAKGLVIDDNQNIWVAHAEGNTVGRLRFNSQTSDWEPANPVTLPDYRQDQQPNHPYGVAVDSSGKIWVANYSSHTAMRIDPLLNGGNGGVDVVVDLNQGWTDNPAYPYNYSDMTGFNNHIVNPGGCSLKGYWTVVEDGGTPDRLWVVSWTPSTPTGTRIEVYARASDDRLALSREQFVQVGSGILIPGVRGRFLEIRTVLVREECNQDPYLEDLTICSLSKTLTLIAPPTDQQVTEGQDAAFEVVAIGTEPLSYQWFLNGSPVGPSSPVLSLLAVDCLDAGQYDVHITDASGDEVDAGPAFLDVIPRPITIPLVGIASVYPAQIKVDGPATVSSVEVVLNGFSHQRPDDVDILLVSPAGRKIVLMSDAGSAIAVQNLTVTFSQSGGMPPDEGQLFSGTFFPSNYGDQESSFPTGGNPDPPTGPYTDTLSDLNGTDPRGEWKLYIVDDTGQRSGSISGSWCLILNP